MPATVTTGGATVPVTWDRESAAKAPVADETLSLTGTATIDGVKTAVAVRYEVVPTAPLGYYIDSGVTSGQTSPAYAAVKASAAGAGRRNDRPTRYPLQAMPGAIWPTESPSRRALT